MRKVEDAELKKGMENARVNRITYRDADGVPHFNYKNTQVSEDDFEEEMISVLLECAAQYEDSGLEPTELLSLASGIPLARLEQLCAAEREGRAVITPCHIGDSFYFNYNGATSLGFVEGFAVWDGANRALTTLGGFLFDQYVTETYATPEAAAAALTCIHKSADGICDVLSDGEVRQPCVEGPCGDYAEAPVLDGKGAGV